MSGVASAADPSGYFDSILKAPLGLVARTSVSSSAVATNERLRRSDTTNPAARYSLIPPLACLQSNRFPIKPDIKFLHLFAMLVVGGFPTVVAILEQDRLVVKAVIGLSNDVAATIEGKLYVRITGRKQRRLFVEAQVSCGGFVAALVELRFPAVISVLVHDRLPVSAAEGALCTAF